MTSHAIKRLDLLLAVVSSVTFVTLLTMPVFTQWARANDENEGCNCTPCSITCSGIEDALKLARIDLKAAEKAWDDAIEAHKAAILEVRDAKNAATIKRHLYSVALLGVGPAITACGASGPGVPACIAGILAGIAQILDTLVAAEQRVIDAEANLKQAEANEKAAADHANSLMDLIKQLEADLKACNDSKKQCQDAYNTCVATYCD